MFSAGNEYENDDNDNEGGGDDDDSYAYDDILILMNEKKRIRTIRRWSIMELTTPLKEIIYPLQTALCLCLSIFQFSSLSENLLL